VRRAWTGDGTFTNRIANPFDRSPSASASTVTVDRSGRSISSVMWVAGIARIELRIRHPPVLKSWMTRGTVTAPSHRAVTGPPTRGRRRGERAGGSAGLIESAPDRSLHGAREYSKRVYRTAGAGRAAKKESRAVPSHSRAVALAVQTADLCPSL